MSQPRLKPFFGYYGSKWRLAPTYDAPKFETIIEPFAGSAGYACLYPDRNIVLVDSNPVIVGIWRYLIRTTAERVLSLPDVPMCDGCRANPPSVCRGANVCGLRALDTTRFTINELALMGMWCSKAPSAPRNHMVPWAAAYPGSSWWGARVRQRIANQIDAIRHWVVKQGDYTDSIAAAALEGESATWFIDPPYSGRPGRTYTHGSKTLQYTELAAWCRDLPGQVIVCEALGADWLPFSEHVGIRGVSRRSKEAQWTK